jgi:selenocysteine-specific translation elongation factor
MRILLIEDDAFKADDVMNFITENYGSLIVIDKTDSYSGGLTKAAMIEYDLLIVDMTLPKYTESNGAKNGVLPTGGEILIETINDMGIKRRSVVLTQYETFNEETIDDIHNRLLKDCSTSYLGYIKYDYTAEEWKNKLKEKINYAFNSNN